MSLLAAYPAALDSIRSAAEMVYASKSAFRSHGFVSRESTSLIELEKVLLETGAWDGLTQGVLYLLHTSSSGSNCIRFYESGSFVGVMQHLQSNNSGVPIHGAAMYRVYNEADTAKEKQLLRDRNEQMSDSKSKSGNRKGTEH